MLNPSDSVIYLKINDIFIETKMEQQLKKIKKDFLDKQNTEKNVFVDCMKILSSSNTFFDINWDSLNRRYDNRYVVFWDE